MESDPVAAEVVPEARGMAEGDVLSRVPAAGLVQNERDSIVVGRGACRSLPTGGENFFVLTCSACLTFAEQHSQAGLR